MHVIISKCIHIKKMVHTIDPKAFTIIVESNEVVGEGFKEEIPDIEL